LTGDALFVFASDNEPVVYDGKQDHVMKWPQIRRTTQPLAR
jgi:hypothetical protein